MRQLRVAANCSRVALLSTFVSTPQKDNVSPLANSRRHEVRHGLEARNTTLNRSLAHSDDFGLRQCAGDHGAATRVIQQVAQQPACSTSCW